MPTYTIRVKGTGCRVKALLPSKQSSVILVRQRRGFLATRVVDAATSDAAGRKVVAMLHKELDDLIVNAPDEPWSLTIEAIERAPARCDRDARDGGFTWFEENTPPLPVSGEHRASPPP